GGGGLCEVEASSSDGIGGDTASTWFWTAASTSMRKAATIPMTRQSATRLSATVDHLIHFMCSTSAESHTQKWCQSRTAPKADSVFTRTRLLCSATAAPQKTGCRASSRPLATHVGAHRAPAERDGTVAPYVTVSREGFR